MNSCATGSASVFQSCRTRFALVEPVAHHAKRYQELHSLAFGILLALIQRAFSRTTRQMLENPWSTALRGDTTSGILLDGFLSPTLSKTPMAEHEKSTETGENHRLARQSWLCYKKQLADVPLITA